MRNSLSLLIASLILSGVSARAQEAFTLDFQLFHDDVLIAAPSVTSRDGEPGEVRLADLFDFEVTPTRVDARQVRVSFEIHDGSRTLRPRMLVSHGAPATVTWTRHAGADDPSVIVEIRVTIRRG